MKLSILELKARRASLAVASVAAVGLLVALPLSAQAVALPVPLGTATSFAVLAGQTITNTGATTVTGDMGVSPGSSFTGMPPLVLTGASHVADAVALGAQAALGTAYDNVAGQTPATPVPNELGGSNLGPGIYSSGVFIITGTLTLNAGGNPNAIFIFQSASTLTAASGSSISLINGASPCNVFWLVPSSATLNSSASFAGTILASTSISAMTGAKVQGRLLARTGSVTLQANTINASACVAATPTPTATTTATTTATPTATPTVTPTIAPTAAPSAAPSAAPTAAASPQVAQVPVGSVASGDGSTSGGNGTQALLASGLLLAGVGGATALAIRRRRLNT